MTLPDLNPDCRNCDALCCVLLAFDRSAAFALGKPACAPCLNLRTDNLCRIHERLVEAGFAGCAQFDCHGAGQRITQTVFKGRSWRADPAVMPAMDQAFRILRRLHGAMVLLQETARLPLDPQQEAQRLTLLDRLSADRDPAQLQGAEPLEALSQSASFFASLRAVTAPRR